MMQTHMLIFSDHCAVLEAGEDLMFVAWFITRKDLRGKGIGGMVIRKCIDSFTPETKIALHAAWGVRDYYASLGFKNRGLVTFTCEGKFEKLIQGKRCDNIEIKELIECNFQDVVNFDHAIDKIDRRDYLQRHFDNCERVVVALRYGKVVGYAGLKLLSDSKLISPMYADLEEAARKMTESLARDISDDILKIIIPEDNKVAREMWADFGITKAIDDNHIKTQLMFKGCQFSFPIDKVYGIIGFDGSMV